MRIIIIILLLVFIGGVLGFLVWRTGAVDFRKLSPDEMRARILAERDLAIAKAVGRGEYRCCIEPPCTMCYMEGNKWNYGIAGTCACDDFIAKGEEACPECARGILEIHSEDGTYCDLNSDISTCGLNLNN